MIRKALVAFWANDPAVTSLLGSRIEPEKSHQADTLPRATYQRLSGGPLTASNDGPSSERQDRIQVTCYAATYDQAAAASRALQQSRGGNAGGMALDGFRGWIGKGVYVQAAFVEPASERDDYTPPFQGDDVGIEQASFDLLVTYREG